MRRTRKIRRALNASEPQTVSRTLTIASALYQVRPLRTTHAPMLELLPEFIEAELVQQSRMPKFRALKRHLLICPRCATVYFDLLETALLDTQHQLPQSETMPRPNLDFLNAKDTGA